MKKLILLAIPVVLSACATPEQQSTVPMDMKAVQDYQYRVATGKTVDKKHKEPQEALNQSDRRSKNKVYYRTAPVIYPSIHYGYGYRYGRWYY